MKISIITFWQSLDNYGQILQCYALQEVLRLQCHQPELIRYGFHKYLLPSINYSRLYQKKEIHNFINHIKLNLYDTINNTDIRKFRKFKRKYIKSSIRTYNNLTDLQNNPPIADCYLAGSDQIWAQLISNKNNRSFFLDFGLKKTKRISYAASFAMDEYPNEIKEELKDLLSNFYKISVREPNGVIICNDIGIDAKLVLDPTLLLTGDHYKRIFKRYKGIPANYCFIYHVNVYQDNSLYWNIIKNYNEAHGFSSIATYGNGKNNFDMKILQGAEYVYPQIGEWLFMINHAKYVVTSSFHGVVFCILFHTPFIFCPLEKSKFSANDRISHLLEKLGLQNRIITSLNCESLNDFIYSFIDWEKVDTVIKTMRIHSLNFLIDSLSSR